MSKKFNARLADQLGRLLAEKAELDKRVGEVKNKLKEAVGPGNAVEGELFRVTVSESVSYKLDMDAVRAKLSPQFISANSREVKKVDVKCVARNNDLRVAA